MNTDSNIFGCFVSTSIGKSTDSEELKEESKEQGKLFRTYIWGESGINQILKNLNRNDYGVDLALVLFEFYVNPLSIEIEKLKKIGNYRKKEKSIGISIIINHDNFFLKQDEERKRWIKEIIIEKVGLLDEKVKNNKLDTQLYKLKKDLSNLLL